MYINQRGQSLSKLMIEHKSKPEKLSKIKGSFQQLYQLLSKQVMPLNTSNRKKHSNNNSTNTRKQSNPEARLRMNVEYSHQTDEQNKVGSHSRQMHSGFKCTPQTEAEERKQRSYKKRTSKQAQISSINQKLKNLILGNRNKKEGKNASLRESQNIIVSHQEIEQYKSDEAKKRSVTEGNQKRSSLGEYLKQTGKDIKIIKERGLSEYLREMPKKRQFQNVQKDLVSKLRTARQKKKLNIRGQHFINNTEIISRSPQAKTTKKDSLKILESIKPQARPQNDIGKCLAQVLMPDSKGVIKKSEIEAIMAKYCAQQQVSEHILWKMQKLQEFYTIFLGTFNCEIKHLQTVKLPKFNRKNQFYQYYVGPGNNRNLIIQTMSRRWWWKECTKIAEADFVWSQEKNESLLMEPPNNKASFSFSFPFERRGSKEKIQIRKYLMSQSKGLSQFFLFHSYKSQKNYVETGIKTIDKETCLHNHLLCGNILGDKKSLFSLIKLWRLGFKKTEEAQLFEYIPETYHVCSQTSSDFSNFERKFRKNEKQVDNLWIVKPGENSNRGRNIFISSSFDEISQAVKIRENLGGSTIIQKYKSDLLLFKGRKFDIRTFLLCICLGGHCKFYWYSSGYARTSSHLFNTKDLSNMIHLTNDAIQNQGQEYGRFEKGNKIGFNRLQKYLKEEFPQKDWRMEGLIDKMKDIAKQISQASYCLVDKLRDRNGFELFGMDFMVDSQFHPWLLEINTNPCLQLSSPLLKALIPNMIENMFRVTVDPVYRPTMFPDKEHEYSIPQKIIENNKFQLIFDSLVEKQQAWEQFSQSNWISP